MLRLDFVERASPGFDDFVISSSKDPNPNDKEPEVKTARPADELITDLRGLAQRAGLMQTRDDLVLLLEVMAQCCSRISLAESIFFLEDLEMTLNSLHTNLNLWKFSSSLADDCIHVWDRFLSYYMRIPEKCTMIFERSDFMVSVPRLFFKKIFSDTSALEQMRSTRCTDRLFNKMLLCGFQDDIYLILSRSDSDGSKCRALLEFCSTAKKVDFVLKMTAAIESSTTSIPEMVENMRNIVLPILLQTDELVSSLFAQLIQYQSLTSTALPILIATICWLLSDRVSISALLKDLFRESRKQTAFLTHLTLVFLSFLEADHLQNDLELTGLITTRISYGLNHPESRIRIMAQILAESYARLSSVPKPLYFNLDEECGDVAEFRRTEIIVRIVDQTLHPGCHFVSYKFTRPEFEARIETPPADDYHQIELAPSQPAKLSPLDEALKSSLPAASISEPRNSKVRTPKFLKDCWDYLNTEDPDKWEISLKILPEVIKNSFQLELRELGPQVFKTLLFLSDQYKLVNFESQRMSILGSFICAIPENCLRALKCEFIGRSLNIGQKSEILTLVMKALKDQMQLESGKHTVKAAEVDQLFAFLCITDSFEQKYEHNSLTMPLIVKNFYLPLLSDLGSVNSKVFATTHDFLLEKTILCLSMFFYFSSNLVEYPAMVPPLLRFLAPVLGNKGASGPIIRATLRAFCALFSTWPDNLEVYKHFEDISMIARWLGGSILLGYMV